MLKKLRTWLQIAPAEESETVAAILGNRPLSRPGRAMVLAFARTVRSAIGNQLADLGMRCENQWSAHRGAVEAYALGLAFGLCDQTEVAEASELVAAVALAQLCNTPAADAVDLVRSLMSRVERESANFVNDRALGRRDARRIAARELPFGLQDSIANSGFQDDIGTWCFVQTPDDGLEVARIVDAVLAQLGLAADEGATTADVKHDIVVMGYVAGVSQSLCRTSEMSPQAERLASAVLKRLSESSYRSRAVVDERFPSYLEKEDHVFRKALAAGQMDGARLVGEVGPALMLVDLVLG